MFYRRFPGKRVAPEKDRGDRPARMIVSQERAAAMQKVAQTSKFGISVTVRGAGEPYQSDSGYHGTVPPGKAQVTLHKVPPEGARGFYLAAKSVERHEKKHRSRQG